MRIRTLCAFAASCLWSLSGVAQESPTDQFSASRFTPAVGGSNYAQVDGAVVAGHLAPTASLMFDYAHRPFVVFQATCSNDEDCELDGFEQDIVSYQVTGHLGGSLAIANRVQFGIVVPVVVSAGDGYHASRGTVGSQPLRIMGGDVFALSDPRLSAKVQLMGKGSGALLAAVVYGTAPVGKRLARDHGVGQKGFTAGGYLVGEYRADTLRFAVNLGGVYRPQATVLSTEIGSELTYGGAVHVPVTSLLGLTGELTGTSRLSSKLDENSLEVRALGHLLSGDFEFRFGAGAGIIGGVGTPVFRVLAGGAFAPQRLDSDGDGVRDADDRCPGAQEDLDGYLDDDGCPEADNDADGMPDDVDQCPDAPEDMDGKDDEDGCPDEDNDGDGVRDGYDSCPNEPEDMDGDRDDDGCPDNDRDRDGVEDSVDQCPNEPEDTDGFADEDGCPEVDYDGDGIPDDADECPDEKETPNGFQDEDGCPD